MKQPVDHGVRPLWQALRDAERDLSDAYAVFWLGHSGWWFALAFVVATTTVGGIEPSGQRK